MRRRDGLASKAEKQRGDGEHPHGGCVARRGGQQQHGADDAHEQEAEFLWRSSRADFLLPAQPRETWAEELDDVDRITDEAYVTSALVTTCGSNRVRFGGSSPLTDADARDRALDQAQARGALQEAFAERLLSDPQAVRARVRETLEQCASAFFGSAWASVAWRIAADLLAAMLR